MRFQKLLILFLAVSFSLGKAQDVLAADPVQTGQAPKINSADNSSDKLLELLEKKQKELDSQEKTSPTTAAEVKTPKTEPVQTPKKAAAQSENFFRPKNTAAAPSAPETSSQPAKVVETQAQTPAISNQTTDAAQDDLLEILRRKQAELDAHPVGSQKQRTVSQPAPKPVQTQPKINLEKPQPSKAPAVARPKVTAPKTAAPKAVASQPALAPEAQDQLVELLRKKQAELDAKTNPTATVETKKSTAEATAATKSNDASEKRIRQIEAEIKAKEEAFKKSATARTEKDKAVKAALNSQKEGKPQTATALILQPGSKEARLDELLRKYKADEITPHDYHMERAKIIAEP